MSLGELAAAAGLAKSTLHALEQGSGNPTLNAVWGWPPRWPCRSGSCWTTPARPSPCCEPETGR